MTDILWTIGSLAALLGWALVPLLDVLWRPDRAPAPFQVLHPVQTGCVNGVPYVHGN